MKKTLTTELLLTCWNILSVAKYGKMDDADKIKVWKATRKIKPVATQFDEDTKDASEKFKPEGDFDAQLEKAQEYERMIRQKDLDATKLPMGAAEYKKFIDEYKAYNKKVDEALKEFAKKEVELEIEPISEEAFGRLMASNDWNVAQAVAVSDVIVED